MYVFNPTRPMSPVTLGVSNFRMELRNTHSKWLCWKRKKGNVSYFVWIHSVLCVFFPCESITILHVDFCRRGVASLLLSFLYWFCECSYLNSTSTECSWKRLYDVGWIAYCIFFSVAFEQIGRTGGNIYNFSYLSPCCMMM